MFLLNDTYLFHHIDISKKAQCQNIKFKRVFQFLHLLLLQRIYGIDYVCRSRSAKQQKHDECEVFLGGSCNPTTWRFQYAIPYFQYRSISYYNPQVANWSEELVEIEYRAKELALLLFFVIDYNTRSLAAIAEVCYLAARGRNLIVVMDPMPTDKDQTRFIQQKTSSNELDNQYDYENVCQARQTLKLLLQNINIPVFDNIHVALDCAAYFIEYIKTVSTEQSIRSLNITNSYHFPQISCRTNESDDDGYGSYESNKQTLSRSSSSVSSESYEYPVDQQYETTFSRFYILCTYAIRYIKHLFHSSPHVNNRFEYSTLTRFDLYIACGERDDYWLKTCVYPILDEINLRYIKREISYDNDPLDLLDNNHIRKRSRLLYYLINNNERLSHLTTELAFLIGERQYNIIVCLHSILNGESDVILTKSERQDIERSRKYLEALAKKENILLYHSREQSWQHVLAFFLQN